MAAPISKNRKSFQGIVVSTKMQKTIVVEVERKFSHPRFKKLVISHKKYHVHDEDSTCKVGDKVKIIETRPYSRTKFYRVQTILEKAK
ncbi:MAG: 30S ribosomal protein S17 [Mycoplasmataceae bacterium]|nr:30S ribosomal protein S17 [Mycoplasmataceae bacterium]